MKFKDYIMNKEIIFPRYIIFLVTLCCGASSCKVNSQRALEDGISGPFGIVAKLQSKSVYILNSSFSGEYRDGNILRYESDELGKISKKESIPVPRLGTELVASEDGKWLAGAFSGANAGLRFFDISAETPVPTGDLAISLPGAVLGQVQFFRPKNAAANDYYLWVVINPRLSGAKTQVIKWNGQVAKTLFTLPDDLPDGRPDDYFLGFGSPAFLKSENLFVALPQGGGGLTPDFPSIPDFFNGNWNKLKADLRLASAVAVNFDQFLETSDLTQASAFVPLVYTKDAASVVFKSASGNPTQPDQKIYDDSSEVNKSLTYQNGFWPSIALNQDGCYDRHPDPKFPVDSMLTVDIKNGSDLNNYRAEIIQIGGWKKVKEIMLSLPPLSASQHKLRLVQNALNYSLYSRTQGVDQISEVPSFIQRLFIADTGAECQPLWARIESDLNSPGSELVRIQTNFSRDPNNPVLAMVPNRGAFSMAVRGSYVYTADYSNGGIFSYKFENNSLTPLK